jgi:hypothetical protein
MAELTSASIRGGQRLIGVLAIRGIASYGLRLAAQMSQNSAAGVKVPAVFP